MEIIDLGGRLRPVLLVEQLKGKQHWRRHALGA